MNAEGGGGGKAATPQPKKKKAAAPKEGGGKAKGGGGDGTPAAKRQKAEAAKAAKAAVQGECRAVRRKGMTRRMRGQARVLLPLLPARPCPASLSCPPGAAKPAEEEAAPVEAFSMKGQLVKDCECQAGGAACVAAARLPGPAAASPPDTGPPRLPTLTPHLHPPTPPLL